MHNYTDVNTKKQNFTLWFLCVFNFKSGWRQGIKEERNKTTIQPLSVNDLIMDNGTFSKQHKDKVMSLFVVLDYLVFSL